MTTHFDPYHKWLGIPAEEQPPHYYRLLGLQLFESDPDAIGNAADQRMRHLKTFTVSHHSSMAEDLLDQVAKARVCLLNPSKKHTYDSQLRTHLPDAVSSPTVAEVQTVRQDEAQQAPVTRVSDNT